MEKHLLIYLMIFLVSLTIVLIIAIIDYSIFKKRIEKILDLTIEVNNNTNEVLNISKEVNDSVGKVCELNNILLKKLAFLIDENNDLRRIIDSNNENNEK